MWFSAPSALQVSSSSSRFGTQLVTWYGLDCEDLVYPSLEFHLVFSQLALPCFLFDISLNKQLAFLLYFVFSPVSAFGSTPQHPGCSAMTEHPDSRLFPNVEGSESTQCVATSPGSASESTVSNLPVKGLYSLSRVSRCNVSPELLLQFIRLEFLTRRLNNCITTRVVEPAMTISVDSLCELSYRLVYSW